MKLLPMALALLGIVVVVALGITAFHAVRPAKPQRWEVYNSYTSQNVPDNATPNAPLYIAPTYTGPAQSFGPGQPTPDYTVDWRTATHTDLLVNRSATSVPDNVRAFAYLIDGVEQVAVSRDGKRVTISSPDVEICIAWPELRAPVCARYKRPTK